MTWPMTHHMSGKTRLIGCCCSLQVYAWLGVTPPRGVLLHGPPGCGKTALAHAIANEMRVPFLRISAPEIVSGMSGESEAKLRGLFKEAAAVAPCIVFIGTQSKYIRVSCWHLPHCPCS